MVEPRDPMISREPATGGPGQEAFDDGLQGASIGVCHN